MSIADTEYNDDQYGYNPDAQTQGTREIVLMPGVFKVTAQVMPRMKDGVPVVQEDQQGNKWPVYVIPSVEVVEPFDEGGRFQVWHEVATKPTNYGNDQQPYVSDGAILLKAIDANAAREVKTFGEAAQKLAEIANSGPVTFPLSTGLTARDSDWAYAQIKEQNLDKVNDRKAIQKIWKRANLPTKAFMTRKGAKGQPSEFATTIASPLSGKTLSAKVKIARFLASDANLTYGVGQFPPKE